MNDQLHGDDYLIREIRLALRKFHDLSPAGDLSVKETPEGQFKVTLSDKARAVSVSHGWEDKRWSYARPNTIDIVLSDNTQKESYFIIMTECRLSDFPLLLKNAYMLTKKFLQEDYIVTQPKRFSPFRTRYAFFDDDSLLYQYAAKAKRFHKI